MTQQKVPRTELQRMLLPMKKVSRKREAAVLEEEVEVEASEAASVVHIVVVTEADTVVEVWDERLIVLHCRVVTFFLRRPWAS